MKKTKTFFKRLLYTLGAIILIAGVAVFVLARMSVQPASMNMGEMDGMPMGSMDHNHAAMTAAPPVRELPMTALTEKPTDAPVKTFDITAEEKTIDTGAGKKVKAWTYGGTVPGQEIRVQQGDRVIVHLKNKLPEGVTIHWHGVELPNAMDGVAGLTQDAVPPGGEFTYDFIAKNPGTYWYHSHQFSNKMTLKGLFGTLVVEPTSAPVKYDRDYTVVLHDWEINGKNDIDTLNGSSAGTRFEAAPGESVRLRVINTASITHTMMLVGAPLKVIAIDAHDIHDPSPLDAALLPIGASQRYDLAFTMPESGAVKLVNADDAGFQGNFFTKLLGVVTASSDTAHRGLSATFGSGDVQMDAAALRQRPVFDFTAYGTPSDASQDPLAINARYDRQFEMKLGNSVGFFNGGFTMRFQINDRAFPDIPSYTVREGDLVKIHIVNGTDISHPMHLHGHSFKLLAKNGKPLSGSPVYLSTLLVEGMESYDIAFVADNPGLWMLHCHNLGHAENGMDMMVNYEGVTTPYTVGSKSGNHPD